MPSLYRLWRTLHSQTESLHRVTVAFTPSLLTANPTLRLGQGEHPSRFDVWRSLHQFSKVANPGKPLSFPQAASRVFATPSVHAPVWQSFSYSPPQFMLDRHQAIRSEQVASWVLTPTNHTSPNLRLSSMGTKLHPWPLILPWESSMCTLSFSAQWGIRASAIPSEAAMHQPFLYSVNWNGCLEESRPGSHKMQGGHSSSDLQRILSTSAVLHLMQLGPSLPSTIRDIFQKALHTVTYGGTAALMHLGLTFDSSADVENTDVREKQRERSPDNKGLKLLSAAHSLPHPDKQDTGGEDAYFICSEKHVVGVADGVGGWADVGVDAGEYARQLMNQSLLAVQQEPIGCINTAHIMEIAHSKTTCRGSSTACILALSDTNLEATNLGDSGFLVVRNGRLVFKSPPQQHNFNVPFQLESGGGDPPAAAQVFTVEVAAGDVIVAGTDGLFDNLYDTEVVSIVVQATRSGASPEITAKKIASLAREHAADCNRQTPFASAAQDAGFRFYGGKMDDITVVVSYVVK